MARFQETINLQQVDPTTGGAAAALSLADQLEGFKAQMTQAAGVQAVKRGEKTGGEAAEQRRLQIAAAKKEMAEAQQSLDTNTNTILAKGKAARVERAKERLGRVQAAPQFEREGLFGSIEATAHNKALRGAYLASLSNDITESVNQIENESPDNVIKFNDEVAGLTKGIMAGVDPASRGDVANFLDGKIISARDRVHQKNMAKDRAEATVAMQTAAENGADFALVRSREGDLIGAAEAILEVYTVYDGMVEAGLMSKPAADKLKRDLEFAATEQKTVGMMRRLTATGDFTTAAEGIQEFRENTPKGLTTTEADQITKTLRAELSEAIQLEELAEDEAIDNTKAEQDSNYVSLAVGFSNGTKTLQDANALALAGDITPEQRDKLETKWTTKGNGANDWNLIVGLQDDIRNDVPGTKDKIITNMNTSLTGAMGAELLEMLAEEESGRAAKAAGGKHFTNDPTYKQVLSFVRRNLQVVGMFGALDSESQQRLATAEREFFTAAQEGATGEELWAKGDQLVSFDDFNTSPKPMYGTKEDLDAAEASLKEAYKRGDASLGLTKDERKATANSQLELINKLRELSQIQTEYDAAKKRAIK